MPGHQASVRYPELMTRDSTRNVDPDSRARTHLANERTFLAWFRTGLAMIALGIAAGEFLGRDVVNGEPTLVPALAVGLVATGILLVAVGLVRHQRGRTEIEAGAFSPASRSVLTASALGIGVGVLAILFASAIAR
jgi:putative membrane protein